MAECALLVFGECKDQQERKAAVAFHVALIRGPDGGTEPRRGRTLGWERDTLAPDPRGHQLAAGLQESHLSFRKIKGFVPLYSVIKK